MKYTVEQQKENRRKWVEALRSENFDQGSAVLKSTDDEYCCLGVACEISGLGDWTESIEDNSYIFTSRRNPVDSCRIVLNEEMQGYLGIQTDYGRFKDANFKYSTVDRIDEYGNEEPGGEYVSLAVLNDSGDFTFNDIADIIESEPEGFIV